MHLECSQLNLKVCGTMPLKAKQVQKAGKEDSKWLNCKAFNFTYHISGVFLGCRGRITSHRVWRPGRRLCSTTVACAYLAAGDGATSLKQCSHLLVIQRVTKVLHVDVGEFLGTVAHHVNTLATCHETPDKPSIAHYGAYKLNNINWNHSSVQLHLRSVLSNRLKWTELKCKFSCVAWTVQRQQTGSSVPFSSLCLLCTCHYSRSFLLWKLPLTFWDHTGRLHFLTWLKFSWLDLSQVSSLRSKYPLRPEFN